MRKNFFKLLIAAFVVMISLCFINTDNVQAATKRLQGGRSMKSAKTVSKNNIYVVKLKGSQQLWYKFKTPKYSTYLSCYAKNLSNTGHFRVRIYSKDEEQLLNSDIMWKNYDVHEYCEYRLKSNTWYYIKVTNDKEDDIYSSGTGNVKFSFALNKDAVPNTMKRAKAVKIKRGYGSSIDGKNDTDWFKFKPKKSGTYTFNLKYISGEGRIEGRIYSKYEEELGCAEVYPYYSKNDSFSVRLKKNQWYYIEIKDSYKRTGKYRFSIT